jgi:potassium-transporting ATPase KdpC subunit
MTSLISSALRATLVTFVLCGLIYPLVLTGLAQWLLPFQANGSPEVSEGDAVIGSRLIGQSWIGPQWFHGRPSATTDTDPTDPSKIVSAPYNAMNSSGSNFGPASKDLADRLARDRQKLEAAQPQLAGKALPADMLTASASGLDPDISPANAHLQAPRVAEARGVPPAIIDELVDQTTTGRVFGIFGEPRVNVMALNQALNKTKGASR